jgi:hypothetical protein
LKGFRLTSPPPAIEISAALSNGDVSYSLLLMDDVGVGMLLVWSGEDEEDSVWVVRGRTGIGGTVDEPMFIGRRGGGGGAFFAGIVVLEPISVGIERRAVGC